MHLGLMVDDDMVGKSSLLMVLILLLEDFSRISPFCFRAKAFVGKACV